MALLRTVLSKELVTLRAPEHAFFGERPCVVWALYDLYPLFGMRPLVISCPTLQQTSRVHATTPEHTLSDGIVA